jgi:hypothetical protein
MPPSAAAGAKSPAEQRLRGSPPTDGHADGAAVGRTFLSAFRGGQGCLPHRQAADVIRSTPA